MARDDGKVWLVNYALPGEVVEAEPRGRQGGVAVAAATRVIEASPHRVAAPCPYFGIRGEFEALATAGGWRFGFHRMRSHSVLPIDSCLIHDQRIEGALPAFARAASELQLKDLQNLLLTVEPAGPGLLWRMRFRGREPRWPRDEYAHRVAELLPESTLLDDAMSLEFWDLT
ncbi:MAG: hypothetical protein E6I41_07345, partial [Chloroflexi bacterium]